MLFYFLCCSCLFFGQVTCDATGQVLCLGPEYRARLSIVLLHPPLCSLVEIPHTKKDLLPRAPCLRKYFSNCVFLGCLGHWWQPLAHSNWIQDNAERVTQYPASHCLQFTWFPRFHLQQIMATWSVEEMLDWCRNTLVNIVCIIHKRHKMARSLKNDRR